MGGGDSILDLPRDGILSNGSLWGPGYKVNDSILHGLIKREHTKYIPAPPL